MRSRGAYDDRNAWGFDRSIADFFFWVGGQSGRLSHRAREHNAGASWRVPALGGKIAADRGSPARMLGIRIAGAAGDGGGVRNRTRMDEEQMEMVMEARGAAEAGNPGNEAAQVRSRDSWMLDRVFVLPQNLACLLFSALSRDGRNLLM